jgi:cytidylate kinase
VSEAIREPVVAEAVSAVSRVPAVRTRLVQIQREVIASGSIVVEGRDIGTVVAPDAGVKIFLTASPLARAQRRNKDYGQAHDEVKATMEALERRDLIDSTRDVSPLAKADDAIEVDTSDLTLDQVIAAVLSIVASR